MTERLTTLSAVKGWMNITTDGSDSLLEGAIDAVSQFILTYCSFPSFRKRNYVQTFRGNGKSAVMLRNWPVLSVSSVISGGTSIGPSSFNNGLPSSGYSVFEAQGEGPQMLDLYGYSFAQGIPSQVSYAAGFVASQDSIIPADPYQVTPTQGGLWSEDIGVTIDDVAAVKVASAPTTGQYAVSDAGVYTFAAADVGKSITMTYSYIPPVISFAATQMVAEWFKMKDRIGIQSKTLGGQETIVYLNGAMTDAVRRMLQPFINVVPL